MKVSNTQRTQHTEDAIKRFVDRISLDLGSFTVFISMGSLGMWWTGNPKSFVKDARHVMQTLKTLYSKGFLSTDANIPLASDLISFVMDLVFDEMIERLKEETAAKARGGKVFVSQVKRSSGVETPPKWPTKPILPLYLKLDENGELVNKKKALGYKKTTNDTLNLWTYNYLILNMYGKCLEYLGYQSFFTDDQIADLEILEKDLVVLLDPMILKALSRIGISITSNIYDGFDTEYKPLDPAKNLNELISVQHGVNTRITLSIPRIPQLRLYRTDRLQQLNELEFEAFKVLSTAIRSKVEEIRAFKYPGYDVLMKRISLLLVEPGKEQQEQEQEQEEVQLEQEQEQEEVQESDSPEKVEVDEVDEAEEALIGDLRTIIDKEFTRLYGSEGLKWLKGVKPVQKPWDSRTEYIFPESIPETKIIFTRDYSLENLIKDAVSLGKESRSSSFDKLAVLFGIIQNFKDITPSNLDGGRSKIEGSFNRMHDRRVSRFYLGIEGLRISVSMKVNLWLCCHFSGADISMLSDFEEFKVDLNIIGKSFVTMKAFHRDHWPVNLFIRDTSLLSPAGSKGLKDIGRIYGDAFKKIELKGYVGKMDLLLTEKPDLFKEYALRDSEITLKHVNTMEDFYVDLGGSGIPLTMSSISKAYIQKAWNYIYSYQVIEADGLSFGDMRRILTPKGINQLGLVGNTLTHFLGSMRGGRNESFMYGSSHSAGGRGRIEWFDYDLKSAYPTGMAFLGHPNYAKVFVVTAAWLQDSPIEELYLTYLSLRVKFKFPSNVKYPCLPVQVDEVTTIYPLEGESNITGLEYLLARSMGCALTFLSGYGVPFDDLPWRKLRGGGDDERESNRRAWKAMDSFTRVKTVVAEIEGGRHPFQSVVKTLIKERGMHPKGSFLNLMYKLIVNSIYGLTGMGLSGKKKFDTQAGSTQVVKGGELSNPLVSGYITAWVRCVIGESMHNIHLLGGKVVSVTTDGFITDLPDLETLLLNKLPPENTFFLRMHSALRHVITSGGDSLGLELVKSEVDPIEIGIGIGIGKEKDPLDPEDPEAEAVAEADNKDMELKTKDSASERACLISWRTRGQLGFLSGLVAMTGFQPGGYNSIELRDLIWDIFETDISGFSYISKRLRTPTEQFKKGGHVVDVFRDQTFSLLFDNKRSIIEKPGFDPRNDMLDSSPWKSSVEYSIVKGKINILTKVRYIGDRYPGVAKIRKGYLTPVETSIRSFIKSLSHGTYGVNQADFNSYDDIIAFIQGFAPDMKLSRQSISNLMNRKMVYKNVPYLDCNIAFVEYVKKHFPYFNAELFFKLPTSIRRSKTGLVKFK